MTAPHAVRLDVALVARGLARSRGHARDLIASSVVRVDGVAVTKVSRPVTEDEVLLVEAAQGVLDASWVSRAAGKLLGALEDLPDGGPDISGVRAADVGACTGGFTQVLLRRGAARVLAIDVGHDQLAPVLRGDPRVVDLPGLNIREVSARQLGGSVDLLVADISFISLTVVMHRLSGLVRSGGDLLLLVKPQFEVGRSGLDGRGVVRPGRWRAGALREVTRSAVEEGLIVRGLVRSRRSGQDGNVEFFAWFVRPAAGVVPPPWQAVSETVERVIDEVCNGTESPPVEPRSGAETERGHRT